MARKKKIEVVERKLGRERAYGIATIDENKIEIDERLEGKHKFLIYVHEILHIIDESKSEEAVIAESKQITNFLWDNGFRKVDLKERSDY